MATIGTKQRYVKGIVAMNETTDAVTLSVNDPTAAGPTPNSPGSFPFPAMGNDDVVEVARPHALHSGSVVTITYEAA